MTSLWKKQHGLCWICREPMKQYSKDPNDPLILSRDHIKSRADDDRPSGIRNILLAHRVCNTKRGREYVTREAVDGIKARAFEDLRQSPHWASFRR